MPTTSTAPSLAAADGSAAAPGSTASAAPVRGSLWLAAATLWQRDMVRFLRQPNRVVSAVLTPVVFWLGLGLGLMNIVKLPVTAAAGSGGVSYLAYLFPGMISMILLFTAIFSTVSVIEDRQAGFMQGVLVAPVPRLAIVLGKLLGGASLATLQGVVLMVLWALTTLFWPAIGAYPGLAALGIAVLVMFVAALGLTAIGMCIAWPLDSTAGFHAIMMLLLLPMWFLSGGLFPLNRAPLLMKVLMYANPMTYDNSALAVTLQGNSSPAALPLAPWLVMLIMVGATAVLALLTARVVARPRKDGLP